jgi:predicted DCC family thiol-disulfide oxidoreductase YuxK
MVPPDQPLLVYDGDCGFCTASAQWITRRWNRPADAVAWQALGPGRLADLGLSLDDVGRAAWWVDTDGRRAGGAAAVGRALAWAPGWWHLTGRLVLTPPLSWIAPGGYWLVARYRHQLPGGTPACRTGV